MKSIFELRGYIDEQGKRRFADWLDRLNPIAAAKVTIALARMEKGNLILIGGGTKKRQQLDIAAALNCWGDYKRRKKKETD